MVLLKVISTGFVRLAANSCFSFNVQYSTNCPNFEQLTVDVKIRFKVCS